MHKITLLFSLLFTSSIAQATLPTHVISTIQQQESALKARIGVAVLDTGTGKLQSYRGDERFPLTSTFKTLACAKLLSDIDAKRVDKNATLRINKNELVSYSPVIENWKANSIRPFDACEATLRTSDNTAANLVLDAIGGPQPLTAFLRTQSDAITRLDRIEPALNEAAINDRRDTTTPNAISQTLHTLLYKEGLTAASQQQLMQWLEANAVTGGLIRSFIPKDWTIADRSGAGGNGARSITAIVTKPNNAPVIVSIYLHQTQATMAQRDAAIVAIGRVVLM